MITYSLFNIYKRLGHTHSKPYPEKKNKKTPDPFKDKDVSDADFKEVK